MLFEAKNGKVFRGIQIDQYDYNLDIDESCYAVRFVLYNEEEYILAHCESEKEAKIKCANFNKIFKTKTHFILVTRISETEYEYETCSTDPSKSLPGTPYGKFTQKQKIKHNSDYSIGSSYVYNHIVPKDYEKPDEFTVGASYLAEECMSDNPIFNDEFAINASFASSDFYEAQNKSSISNNKDDWF